MEQLCINYANEKLQKHFIDAVGKLQLDDYAREGVQTEEIRFPDNGAQIECIDGRCGHACGCSPDTWGRRLQATGYRL